MPFVALLEVSLPTYEPEACPLCAQSVPVVKPGSRHAGCVVADLQDHGRVRRRPVCRLAAPGQRHLRPGTDRGRASHARRSRGDGARRRANRCRRARARPGGELHAAPRHRRPPWSSGRSTTTCPTPCESSRPKKCRRRFTRGSGRSRRRTGTGSGTPTSLSPFQQSYAWFVRGPLAIDAMQAAARPLEGRHDFAAFQAADGTQRTTEREVFASRLVAEADDSERPGRSSGRLITYEISGSGFLRHMVRAIAGSLVEVGCGRRGSEWMSEVLASRDRTRRRPHGSRPRPVSRARRLLARARL